MFAAMNQLNYQGDEDINPSALETAHLKDNFYREQKYTYFDTQSSVRIPVRLAMLAFDEDRSLDFEPQASNANRNDSQLYS